MTHRHDGRVSAAARTTIDRVAEETGFSGVVHLSRRGRLLYERACGLADRAHGIANTTQTQFAIASTTKGLTALAVMSLIAEGSLTLDTSVRGLLGGQLELVDPAVTVGHLLAHTSGVGDYLDEAGAFEVTDYVLQVPVHRLTRTADYRPSAISPRSGPRSSTAGSCRRHMSPRWSGPATTCRPSRFATAWASGCAPTGRR
jgi:CubicO group peptidase (beta-lactamase class C family)